MIGPTATWITPSQYKGTTKFLRKRKRKDDEEENPFLQEVEELKATIPEWNSFFSKESDEVRGNHWIRLEVLGLSLLEKYSWAIPDDKALKIATAFSPLVEIGAGKGYWASLLRNRGVNIDAYDKYIASERDLWCKVFYGTSSILRKYEGSEWNLFLCYPDEDCELSWECLQRFTGQYIVHVGELLVTGTLAGGLQAPFGRTTTSMFQMELFRHFYCVISYRLPNFPYSNDYITVWKRKTWVPGRSGKAEDQWTDIPTNERLVMNIASPEYAHLL
jgi:hypothetical protein